MNTAKSTATRWSDSSREFGSATYDLFVTWRFGFLFYFGAFFGPVVMSAILLGMAQTAKNEPTRTVEFTSGDVTYDQTACLDDYHIAGQSLYDFTVVNCSVLLATWTGGLLILMVIAGMHSYNAMTRQGEVFSIFRLFSEIVNLHVTKDPKLPKYLIAFMLAIMTSLTVTLVQSYAHYWISDTAGTDCMWPKLSTKDGLAGPSDATMVLMPIVQVHFQRLFWMSISYMILTFYIMWLTYSFVSANPGKIEFQSVAQAEYSTVNNLSMAAQNQNQAQSLSVRSVLARR